MKAILLSAMILALHTSCSPYDGTVLEISVCADLPADSASLRTQVLLAGQPLSGAREHPPAECRFGLALPEGATGDVQVKLDVLASDRCLLARGAAQIQAAGERHLAVPVPLHEEHACPLQVTLAGPGAGTLRSSDPPGLLECGPRGGLCVAPEVPLGTTLKLVTASEPGSYPLDFAAGACDSTTGSGVDERGCVLTMRGAQTLRAQFQRKPGLTVVVSGSGRVRSQPTGIDCQQAGAGCAALFDPAQEVVFRAEAAEGSYFTGWDAPGCEGVAPCALRAGVGMGLRARFAPRLCSTTGWCWESPLPQGNDLRAVHGLASDALWAVGDAGTILSFDGQRWSGALGEGGGNDLYAVLAVASNDVWAAGARGTLLRWQGSRWQSATFADQMDPGGRTLYALWSAGGGELWALGRDGFLCRSTGDVWRCAQEGPAGQELRAVWSAGADEIWVVGSGGTALRGKRGAGPLGGWSRINQGVEQAALSAVVGTADGARYVLADRALWRLAPGQVVGQERWALARAGSFDGLMVLEDGTLVAVGADQAQHLGAQGWSTLAVKGGAALRAVTALPGGGAWAVGARGALARYQGGVWENPLPAVAAALRGVGGDGQGGALAVGEAGVMLRRDGASGRWLTEPPQSGETLMSVWETGPGEAWVAGWKGTLLRFQAGLVGAGIGVWEKVQVPTDKLPDQRDFYALTGQGGALFVGGNLGTLLRHDLAAKPAEGWDNWTPRMVSGSSSQLRALALLNGALYAAGSSAVLLVHARSTHSGDQDWEEKQAGSPIAGKPLATLFPVGSDLWAAGGGGRALVLPRQEVRDLPGGPGGMDVRAGGAAATGLWLVGSAGTLIHGTGSPIALSAVASGTRVNLNQIFVRPSGEAWTVGDAGTILRAKGL